MLTSFVIGSLKIFLSMAVALFPLVPMTALLDYVNGYLKNLEEGAHISLLIIFISAMGAVYLNAVINIVSWING